MENNNNKYKILYLPKEICIYSILLAVLFNIFVSIIFNNMTDIRGYIQSISYLIGSLTIILLFQSIMSIHKREHYLIISFIYTFIALFSIYSMIPANFNSRYWMKSTGNNICFITMYIEMIGIFFKYVNTYILKLYYKINLLEVIIITSLSFFAINICIMKRAINILLIFNYILLACFFINIHRLKEVKLKVGNNINISLLLAYMLVVITMLNIFVIKIPNHNIIIDEIINIMMFASFVLLTVNFIDKLISRPYKVLFSDLYKENIEMELLNNRVVKKNRELEFSQSIIKKKEKMFKTFFTSMPVPLVLLSINGRIIFANSSFQKLIEEENIKNIINKKILKIIDINDMRDFLKALTGEMSGINASIKCKEEKKHVNIEIIDISQNNTEFLMIFDDVTSKIKIGKLKTEMENNKFQEKIKSDFLSNISHDLKTPVNVIYSAAQLVPVFIKNNNKESLNKYNMICKLNCLSLIRLTNNLIDSSRIYSDYLSPNLKVKNIVEIIEETVMSLIDYSRSKAIDLVFDTDQEEVYVKIDEEFMQRIIINLVSNSIKFTQEEGKIEVSINDEEDRVIIHVKDNGIGMDSEFIERAFNRYSMGENNASCNEKGTGIGLFVVKKLIEKQNGNININSKINNGTDVEIIFYKEI
ncbi:His Kinase A (phospho-acceptor) domain-containing protein [Clostridium sp. DSM 8431]|uniref:sensor histidine kinase n=1 Tax=Clostridium sp. DSM 8431 TaxID=1761781 RepID=UPI0008E694FF|nr:HAMP domain-containing sensor histidine kinase [Clostridium sp. DSM 8431]SFU54221.1 His Kinase A (phospho-acceptor) domain-containing protein [Clostridium sp. DSM 8431]